MIGIFGNSGELATHIGGLIPDNNAGQISAADVRESIVSTAVSINSIVSSGDFSATPFVKNVTIKRTDGQDTGRLIVQSGITFSANNSTQYVAYPGPGSILHNTLDGKDIGDPHPQYVPISGTRTFINNVGFSNHWINASGSSRLETTNGKGLQFTYISASRENINVGSGTQFTFLRDKSVISSARGVAKAWINFDASGSPPVVKDSFNVSGLIKESAGQFVVVFHSGVLDDNNYAAIAQSNASSVANLFQKNTVGLTDRTTRADGTRSIKFKVIDDGGEVCDAKFNDLIVYGTEPNGSGQPPVTVTVL
jgi:hypothetical protein